MVEISASILDVKEEESAKTFYNLEVAKTDYFHIDVIMFGSIALYSFTYVSTSSTIKCTSSGNIVICFNIFVYLFILSTVFFSTNFPSITSI